MRRMMLMPLLFGCTLAVGGCAQETQTLERNLKSLIRQYADLNTEKEALQAQVEKLTSTGTELAWEKDVLRAQYEAMVKEKERLASQNSALQTDLGAKADTLSRDILELRQKNTAIENDNLKLQEAVASLEKENVRLKEEIAVLQRVREEEVQKTSKTYEELLEKMKGEIAKEEVTVSELKGKLTVNMVEAILFDSGHAEVKLEGFAVLQKVVDILKGVEDKMIRVEGHTDNQPIGSALAQRFPSNWELSAARAINVTRHLQARGIDPTLLAAMAYGEFKPVAGNDTAEGRTKNRRIEIILVPKE